MTKKLKNNQILAWHLVTFNIQSKRLYLLEGDYLKRVVIVVSVFLFLMCGSRPFVYADTTSSATRLNILKTDIVSLYDSMNKKSILVVGPKDFLRAFRGAVNKNPKYTYATSASKLKCFVPYQRNTPGRAGSIVIISEVVWGLSKAWRERAGHEKIT